MVEGTYYRIFIFAACLLVFGAAERLFPRRARLAKTSTRIFANLGIVTFNNIIIRILFPILPVGLAFYLSQHNIGLFNMISLPAWIEFVIAVMFLDMIIYWQHVAFHKIPVLWRLHISHHVDLDIDMTTGVRFHPVEIILSVFIKFGGIILIGASIESVIFFEIILNATALFNHANMKLPIFLDKYLRLVLVTPDMHRVHHSVIMAENRRNYGFNLSWWDRLFGSYKAQPEKGHTDMTIGLSQYRESNVINIWQLLKIPFTQKTGAFAKATTGKY